MAMFGSENPAMMGGGAVLGGYGGSMDPMMLEQMMKNMPELKARQRRAEELRGAREGLLERGQNPGEPSNYAPQVGGAVQQWQPDYSQIGKAAQGVFGMMAGKPTEAAAGAADSMFSQEALGTAQAYGGGNTGGRMGFGPGMGFGDALGAGLQAAAPGVASGMGGGPSPTPSGAGGGGRTSVTPGPYQPGTPGSGGSGSSGLVPGQMGTNGPAGGPPGGGGMIPGGPIRQNMGMNNRGNQTLANLSRWFGQ